MFYIRPKLVKRSGGPKRQQQQQQQQQQQHKRKIGSGTAAHLPPEQRAKFIAQRQKRIRQQLGLQPPDGSPWTDGHICPNPLLKSKLAEWRAAGLLSAAP